MRTDPNVTKKEMEKAFNRKDKKPFRLLYILLGFLFLNPLFLLFVISDNKLVSLITGLGCGGLASIIIAWIIDKYTCERDNHRSQEMRTMCFLELIFDLRQVIQYIPVAIKLKNNHKDEHTWIEWVELAEGEDIPITEGARRLQKEMIQRAQEDISKLLDQKLMVLSLGLITDDEMINLLEIRTSLSALDIAFSQKVEESFLKLSAKDLHHFIQKARIVAFLNDEKFSIPQYYGNCEESQSERDNEN